MTNSEIRKVYLFMNSQSCSRHSSDTYCRTDIGTVGWVGATTAPVFRRMISEPRLCLLEAWIQKLERESRLRLQGNDLMVCMEQKHRVRSTLSSLEVCGIHISNLLSPNLLVLNLRQTWLLLSSQHIWEGGTSLVLSPFSKPHLQPRGSHGIPIESLSIVLLFEFLKNFICIYLAVRGS